MEDTITGLGELMEFAAKSRDENAYAVLYVVGNVRRSINPDGSVVNHIGQVAGNPVYEIITRGYKIVENGGIKMLDDHPDWLEAGNEEEERIHGEHLEQVIISQPLNEDLKTPESADQVLVYPRFSEE